MLLLSLFVDTKLRYEVPQPSTNTNILTTNNNIEPRRRNPDPTALRTKRTKREEVRILDRRPTVRAVGEIVTMLCYALLSQITLPHLHESSQQRLMSEI